MIRDVSSVPAADVLSVNSLPAFSALSIARVFSDAYLVVLLAFASATALVLAFSCVSSCVVPWAEAASRFFFADAATTSRAVSSSCLAGSSAFVTISFALRSTSLPTPSSFAS